MGRLRDPDSAEVQGQVREAVAGIVALQLPGLLAMTAGPDAGLREGGWSFAIVNDWADAEAYRTYDLDAEHNRHRAVLVAACADIARVQFEL